MLRTSEKGTCNDRCQPKDVLRSSIKSTAPVPGGVASGQNQQRILAPSTHQKVLNRHSLPDNSTECGGPPAQQFDERFCGNRVRRSAGTKIRERSAWIFSHAR